jgi:hypothetical protein
MSAYHDSAARRNAALTTPAAFILKAATAAGIRIGTNGTDLLCGPQRGKPNASWFSFERAIAEHREEIIHLIMTGRAAS